MTKNELIQYLSEIAQASDNPAFVLVVDVIKQRDTPWNPVKDAFVSHISPEAEPFFDLAQKKLVK